jgi:undecaprenyl-diphosphatase
MIESLEKFDRELLLAINSIHTPMMDVLMWYTSKTWPTIFIVLFVAYVFFKRFSPRKAVEFLVGICLVFACTDLTSNLAKHGVKRYRPTHNLEIKDQVHKVIDDDNGKPYTGGQYTFFSGHAANTFGVITFIFFCVNWVPLKYRFLFFIYPLIVVYSRMYLGVHYPFDIFTGTIIGLIFGSLGFYIMNLYFLKLDVQKT